MIFCERTLMDRRVAIKWMLTAAAAMTLLERAAFSAETPAAVKSSVGYGTDPNLLKTYDPGDLWPLTFSPEQTRAAVALCDVIIPADARSPSASSVGVPDFIDEWISAPYTGHDLDRALVLEGLAWLDEESERRFGNDFTNLVLGQQRLICDDICHTSTALDEFKKSARFFSKFRDLAAGAFYSTAEGMKDVGYVGNVPLTTFEGPPSEVLEKLGLV